MGSRVHGRSSLGCLLGMALLGGALLLPSGASAQAKIVSKHQSRYQIEGEAEAYARVGAARPFILRVTGPGALTLTLRKELDGPRGPTLARIMRDGRPIGKLRLAPSSPVSLAAGKGQAGAAQTRKITIPGGSHRVVVKTVVRGHGTLVAFSYEPDLGDLPGLVSLTDPAETTPTGPEAMDLDTIALVGLDDGPSADTGSGDDPGDLDAIALVGLTGDSGASPDDPMDLGGIELVGLGGDPDETNLASATGAAGTSVSVDTMSATADAGLATGGSGALIGAPLHPDPPATPRGPGKLILGLRGVAARVGLGSGAMGGGLDLLYRPDLLGGKLLLGLSVDFLPQRLYRDVVHPSGATSRFDVSLDALPILLTGIYQLGKGRLRFWAAGSAGLAWVSVTRGGEAASAIHPAGALAFGPALRLGPGHLTAAVRLTASHGAVKSKSDASEAMSAGTLAGAGLTLGYAIEI